MIAAISIPIRFVRLKKDPLEKFPNKLFDLQILNPRYCTGLKFFLRKTAVPLLICKVFFSSGFKGYQNRNLSRLMIELLSKLFFPTAIISSPSVITSKAAWLPVPPAILDFPGI